MKIKIYIIASIVLMSFYSCNKWLTLTPKGQVDANELLTTVAGYNAALGGLYYTLSSKSLYGKEMTYGTMDAMAQYWDTRFNPLHNYYYSAQYDYNNTSTINQTNNVWKLFYSIIAECNRILEGLEQNRGDIEYSELFEGEALGLRAFCHMELFKLYGPVIKSKSDLEKKAIAYRTKFDVTPLEFMTGNKVLGMAEVDLKKALLLMENDPIKTIGRSRDGNTSLLNYNAALSRRGSRMNCYAVLAMLARLEQMRLNQSAAYTYADKLITESKATKTIDLINKSNIESTLGNKDYNYTQEMVFSVYINDLWDRTDADFGMNEKAGDINNNFIINADVYQKLRDELYFRSPDGSANDNRYRYWLAEKNNLPGQFDMVKLRRQPSYVAAQYLTPEIGIFRISEAYYIACEAQIGKNNTLALELLNTVRRTRNLEDIVNVTDSDLLKEYLLREQRKDFIGDGIMFYVYKRRFETIYISNAQQITPSDENFVWPIPDTEYEFSPNIKPEK